MKENIAKCDRELGIGPCKYCEREERMNRVSNCICKAGYKMSCPVHGLQPDATPNIRRAGQIVIDIFDESQTEWTVWEQRGEFVMVYIPAHTGMVTVKPAAHLYLLKDL